MTDEMSAARFAELAAAYGGDLGRWPAEQRAAAFVMARSSAGQSILADAAILDAQLDAFEIPPISMAVMERVLATVPQRRIARAGLSFRRWWSLAAVGFAGTATGAFLVAAVPLAPNVTLDPPYEQTAFGNLPTGEAE